MDLALLAKKDKKKEKNISSSLSVPPQGLEPWTPTLRVSWSTN